ncbi:MAG: hypothetical protein ABFS03_14400, partial [Chloroflexota bacterium]
QHADTAKDYEREAELSLALSANMDIEMPAGETVSVEIVHPTNLLLLLGGLIGVLVWLLWNIARFSYKGAA